MLTAAANNALAASAAVPEGVEATTMNSNLTLIGHVPTEAQRDAVVRAAWRGHAVMAVVDQIEITG